MAKRAAAETARKGAAESEAKAARQKDEAAKVMKRKRDTEAAQKKITTLKNAATNNK